MEGDFLGPTPSLVKVVIAIEKLRSGSVKKEEGRTKLRDIFQTINEL